MTAVGVRSVTCHMSRASARDADNNALAAVQQAYLMPPVGDQLASLTPGNRRLLSEERQRAAERHRARSQYPQRAPSRREVFTPDGSGVDEQQVTRTIRRQLFAKRTLQAASKARPTRRKPTRKSSVRKPTRRPAAKTTTAAQQRVAKRPARRPVAKPVAKSKNSLETAAR